MKEYIVLLDPSLSDNEGSASSNTGDVIISESITKILQDIFPQMKIVRISTHSWFGDREKKIIKDAAFTFAGGSNMLSSDIRHFSRLTPEKKKFFYLFPGFKNVILLGTGWCSYEGEQDIPTRLYYRNILHQRFLNAVRDNYSLNKLKKACLRNIVNTSCPTTWNIDPEFINQFDIKRNKLLFTLTDYEQDPEADSAFIRTLLALEQRDTIFFPQGSSDLEYLNSLEPYKKNRDRFKFIGNSFPELEQFVKTNQFNYAGTRLHAGLYSLQSRNPALILSIDNRAAEIGKDILLNVADRKDSAKITDWLFHGFIPPKLNLPVQNIAAWKNQFAQYNQRNPQQN